ncbi:class II glutamine amidotransferase [Desulfurococcus mucosus]|uniref:Glutamine amidotransferase class-II n=1 Tax=Desulfurococcus mucosus (strain ATCC 35584 / DSM 2162 / JCM 9187 / O7/1) TaxID=765177 RepID=E8R9G4_DESM0|nr:class II glutamine amidotransferase [Desulfurococcus mucosus]ADV65140.1 glutamine amidotransferase class-II [Desulfurococcus mucosus DSM 2162]
MCRLFGLYANRPVDVYFSFFESPMGSMVEFSHENPSGWGIAWLDEGGWHVYKEPLPLYSSAKAREVIQRRARGRIVVSHVRLASVGDRRRGNTHPWLYRSWVFAHNGTIHDRRALLGLLDERHRSLDGDTDSEAFFHLVVQEAEEYGDPVEGIRRAVEKIIAEGIGFSSLNFIASDGERLYALRYATTSLDYYTLYYRERPGEGFELRKLSKETRQLIAMKLAYRERAVLVASEPMSDEPYWNPIPNKHLIVVNSGLDIELIPMKTPSN